MAGGEGDRARRSRADPSLRGEERYANARSGSLWLTAQFGRTNHGVQNCEPPALYPNQRLQVPDQQ